MLANLVERIENAIGSDRALDEAIATALGWRPVPNPTFAGGLCGRWYDADGKMTSHFGVPRYTASLDDAMGLVMLGAKLAYQNFGDVDGRHMWLVSPNERFASAATAPLALCATALRAREQEGD